MKLWRTKKVILSRGWPSSGKTTACKVLQKVYPKLVICSADHYFINEAGEYVFDKNKLGAAHFACKNKFIKALISGENYIVVDNTNLKFSEVRDYITHAAVAGYEIYLMGGEAPWKFNTDECVARNAHGVPRESIARMMDGYQTDREIIDQAYNVYGIKVQLL